MKATKTKKNSSFTTYRNEITDLKNLYVVYRKAFYHEHRI